MTHMPARIVLQPDVWDVLLQQVQDENAALHAENGRLRAENERLRDEGNAKDAEIERQRAEIAALQARLGRPKKTPRNSSVPPSQGAKPNAAANPPAAPARPGPPQAAAFRHRATRRWRRRSCFTAGRFWQRAPVATNPSSQRVTNQ